jgi:hypothetical protein
LSHNFKLLGTTHVSGGFVLRSACADQSFFYLLAVMRLMSSCSKAKVQKALEQAGRVPLRASNLEVQEGNHAASGG